MLKHVCAKFHLCYSQPVPDFHALFSFLGGDEEDIQTVAVDPNSPKINVPRPTVVATEGSVATLTVVVRGSPSPDVYWRRAKQDLDTRRGKYKVLPGGTLQV